MQNAAAVGHVGDGAGVDGDEGQELPEGVTGLPRAHPEVEELPSSVSPLGEVPARATYWGIRRQSMGGRWEVLSWGAPGEDAEVREWPITDLSVKTIQARWGAGTYQVQWLQPSGAGGRKHLTYGRPAVVRAAVAVPDVVAPAPGVAPASPFGPEFTHAMQIMGVIKQSAASDLQNIRAMADLMGGGNRGLGGAELQLILQNQAAQTAALMKELVASAVAPLHAKLAEIEARDDDDEDDAGGGLAAVAQAGAGLIKGKGWLGTVLNWAQGNPDLAKEVIKGGMPIIASAATKIAEVVSAPQPRAPMPRAQAPVVVTSTAPPVAPATHVHAPAAPEPEPGSLSSWGPAASSAPNAPAVQ